MFVQLCSICPVHKDGCSCPMSNTEVPGNLMELVRSTEAAALPVAA